ncbi:MAG: tetraacyldisaccharide 4'-kinase [Cellvibrionaceae bacterium]|nr:tetraacyldisaccharide 4'-kinase [Cellvibrionaceae bacterium]
MAKASLAQRISEAWYQDSGDDGLLKLLRPLSKLFTHIAKKRRLKDSHEPKSNQPIVVVVGNIAVGGTGKTPLIIALVEKLREQGYKPGVISRGYGSKAPAYPYEVSANSPVEHCGDEPLLIASLCDCPLVIDADRNRALQQLQQNHDVDIVLSDDGLQHYRLARHIEMAVLDGSRGLGNGWCLPAGPLREPPGRLEEVDFRIINESPSQSLHPTLKTMTLESHKMALAPMGLKNLHSGEQRQCNTQELQAIAGKANTVQAIAGIGNPGRFFDSLRSYGLTVEAHPFDDHQQYSEQNLSFAFNKPLLMTAKDGVKCQTLAQQAACKDWWQLEVQAQLPDEFWQAFFARLDVIKRVHLKNT